MKANSPLFKILSLTIISVFLLLLVFVAGQSALGSTMNPGKEHKTAVLLNENLAHFNLSPVVNAAKGVSNHLRTEQRNKSVPVQASNKPGKRAISDREAAVAGTSAAVAALFGAVF